MRRWANRAGAYPSEILPRKSIWYLADNTESEIIHDEADTDFQMREREERFEQAMLGVRVNPWGL